MDFLKKHYEKVLLSLVLLGLALGAAALPVQVKRVNDELADARIGMVTSRPKPFESVDLSTNQMILNRLETPARIQLASEHHNLFNPVRWRRPAGSGGGPPMRETHLGVNALRVAEIQPLYLRLELTGVGTPDSRHTISVLDQSGASARPRTRQFSQEGDKSGQVTLVRIRTDIHPAEADVRWLDEDEIITITTEKPYERIIGYTADLVYQAGTTRRPFNGLRPGSPLSLPDGAERHKVIAITKDEVTVEAESTKKRTTISRMHDDIARK